MLPYKMGELYIRLNNKFILKQGKKYYLTPITKLSEWNGINYKKEDFSNNLQVGKSKIFGKTTQYHPMVLWICLLTSFLMLVWVIFSSILQVNKKMKEIEYE